MKVTNLALKHVYFEEIRKGLKKVEYRDLNAYYIEKFLDLAKYAGLKMDEIKIGLMDGNLEVHRNDVTHIQFFENGRRLLAEIKDIKIYESHPIMCISLGKIMTV